MKTCPSHEQLEHFSNGRLSDFDRAAVDAHVQTCSSCRETVSSLTQGEPGTTAWNPTPTPKEKAALPPELVDHPRYRVLELLDVGGMGAVYKAEHRLLERPVVLKAIRQDLLSKPQQVQRFLRQPKLSPPLLHPHLVTLFL